MIKLVKKSNEIRIYILSNESIRHFSYIANIKHFADINKWAIWFSTTRNILLIFKELLHNILSFFMDPRKYPFSEWKSEVIIIGAD